MELKPMTTLDQELTKCRERWTKAREQGDETMCRLWERVGNSIKARIEERAGKPIEPLKENITDAEIEKIFDGKLQI